MSETLDNFRWRSYASGLTATLLCTATLVGSTAPSSGASHNPSIDRQEIIDAPVTLRSTVPAICGDPGPDRSIAAQELTMACLINYARQEIMENSVLLRPSAEQKAADIIRCDDWQHDICGKHWARDIPTENFKKWGENLAYGNGAKGTAVEMFLAWMNSSAHRANILDPAWDEFSIVMKLGKVSFDADRKPAHIWVAHFGQRS